MGSKKDLADSIAFLAEHKITPVVSHVLNGLEEFERGFDLMKRGEQFGKIVIDLGAGKSAVRGGAKL
jgi:D-arabinose 1-dehydrogenase-like Zn-dependent alcohol dehydrogenase